jgi:putative flavoprotein involved in K+ transport
VLDVANVVWCTGYGLDFSWIDLPIFDEDGRPLHRRGIVESEPGLYFMGLVFLHLLSSALIGGAGRDAEHIAKHIVSRKRAEGRAHMAAHHATREARPARHRRRSTATPAA